MTRIPAVAKVLAGLLLLASSVTHAVAQDKYTPAVMLDSRLGPKFDDIVITVPTPDELKSCTVESIRGNTPNSGGYVEEDDSRRYRQVLQGNYRVIYRFDAASDTAFVVTVIHAARLLDPDSIDPGGR